MDCWLEEHENEGIDILTLTFSRQLRHTGRSSSHFFLFFLHWRHPEVSEWSWKEFVILVRFLVSFLR